MTTNEVFLTHYLQQSCGWIKVAEYACRSREMAEKIEQDVRLTNPNDILRFDVR